MGSSPSKSIFVGPTAKYRSLADAIHSSVTGGTIYVLPGTYTETKEIFIDKSLHILGVDSVRSVNSNFNYNYNNSHEKGTDANFNYSKQKPKLPSSFFPVKVSAAFFINHSDIARRVTFENIEFSSNGIGSPINLLGGSTLIYNCKIVGTSSKQPRDGIVIRGRSVTPLIRNVVIEDMNCGVAWTDGSTGMMNDCIINKCVTGILIKELSDPHITNSKVLNCTSGVLVIDKGKGIFNDCLISNHNKSSVQIFNGGKPIMTRCEITGSELNGVYCHDAGCVLASCVIAENEYPGIAVCNDANPILTGCSISDGKNAGALIYDRGRGVFESCKINGNNMPGIEVRAGGAPVISNCDIYEGNSNGVYVHNRGRGLFVNTTIRDAHLPSVAIRSGGDPLMQKCKISTGKDNALLIYDRGKGTFIECIMKGETTKPIEIRDGCTPLLHHCTNLDVKHTNILKWLSQIPRDPQTNLLLAPYPSEPRNDHPEEGEQKESVKSKAEDKKKKARNKI